MVILICFDLPRKTSKERKQATRFRKRLLELGFSMKQYSVYERYVASSKSIENILEILNKDIPSSGKVVLYTLSDETHSNQKIILGDRAIYEIKRTPKLVYL